MREPRFLHSNHKWRINKSAFDGTIEKVGDLILLSGDDVLTQLQKLQPVTFGKTIIKAKDSKNKDYLNWKKNILLSYFIIEKFYCDIILMLCTLRKIYVKIILALYQI